MTQEERRRGLRRHPWRQPSSSVCAVPHKALVLEAFAAGFNKRDPGAYERYWSPNYIQHSTHIGPVRDGFAQSDCEPSAVN
jgi:hypothetical protein